MKSGLEQRVNKRMAELRKDAMADYKKAKARMTKAELARPDAMKVLQRTVSIIEMQDAEDRLSHLEELLETLKNVTGEVAAAIVNLEERAEQRGKGLGEADAYKSMAQRLDSFGYRMLGQRWVDAEIASAIKKRYGRKGNGH
jgi:hypothetical protein